MNLMDIENVLGLFGVNYTIMTGYVHASCPLARWTHENGTDRKPSMSVFINESGISGCKCHAGSCGFSGTVYRLAREFEGYVGECGISKAVAKAEQMDFSKMFAVKPYSESKVVEQEKVRKANTFDEDKVVEIGYGEISKWMNSVPKYFLQRGFAVETAKAFELGYDKFKKGIVAPIRDRRKRLVGFTLRRLNPRPFCFRNKKHVDELPDGLDCMKACSTCKECWEEPKWQHIHFKREWFLYGEAAFIDDGRPNIITEGPADVWRAYQAGCNGLGTLGSSVSDVHIRKIIEMCGNSPTYLGFDGDAAGRNACKKAREELDKRGFKYEVLNLANKEDLGGLTENKLRSYINGV